MMAKAKIIGGLVMGWLLASSGPGFTQSIATPPDSIVQLTAEAASLPLVPPAEVPFCGTFWLVEPSAGGCMAAPLPCPPFDPSLPIYEIADGQFLVDGTVGLTAVNTGPTGLATDRSTVVALLAAQSDAVLNLIEQIQAAQFNRDLALAFGFNEETDSPEEFSPMFVNYDTNGLWLEITNVSNGWSYLNLHNATNQVYAISGTTNLPANWQVECELWPTTAQTNVLSFTVPTLDRPNLFLRAEDWTGVDSDGDGLPDWWEWKYFGQFNQVGGDLDVNGRTLLYDYQHGLDPTVPVYDPDGSLTFTNGLKLFLFEPKPGSRIL